MHTGNNSGAPLPFCIPKRYYGQLCDDEYNMCEERFVCRENKEWKAQPNGEMVCGKDFSLQITVVQLRACQCAENSEWDEWAYACRKGMNKFSHKKTALFYIVCPAGQYDYGGKCVKGKRALFVWEKSMSLVCDPTTHVSFSLLSRLDNSMEKQCLECMAFVVLVAFTSRILFSASQYRRLVHG